MVFAYGDLDTVEVALLALEHLRRRRGLSS